jgi:hypothetical protein
MKNIATLIRHTLTFLAGLGGMLVTYSVIAPSEVDAVNAAGSSLIEPLTVIGGAIAAGIARLAIGWLRKRFLGPARPGKETSGGASLLMLAALGTMAGIMGFLPSCSSGDLNSRGWPVTLRIVGPDGTVSYSPKSGLEVEAEVRATK